MAVKVYPNVWEFDKPPRGTAAVNRAHPLARDLVALWPFDDGPGGKVRDLVTRRDATLNYDGGHVARVNWVAGPRSGPALTFPGGGPYAVTDQALAVPAKYTVVTHVRVDSAVSYARVIENGYATGFFIGLDINGTGFAWYCANTPALGGTVTLGKWAHLAGTSDGRLVVNGAQVAVAPPSPTAQTLPVYFGAYPPVAGGGQYSFNGRMDHAMVFGRELTNAEIAGLYRAPRGLWAGPP